MARSIELNTATACAADVVVDSAAPGAGTVRNMNPNGDDGVTNYATHNGNKLQFTWSGFTVDNIATEFGGLLQASNSISVVSSQYGNWNAIINAVSVRHRHQSGRYRRAGALC